MDLFLRFRAALFFCKSRCRQRMRALSSPGSSAKGKRRKLQVPPELSGLALDFR